MNIGSLCKREALVVPQATTITQAAAAMREHGEGYALIVDNVDHDVPLGILTDRDIAFEVVALHANPDVLTVGDLLHSSLVVVAEGDSCEDVVRLMLLHSARHVIVVDDGGCLLGVATLEDMLPCFSAPLAQLSHLARRARHGETVGQT